MYEVKEKRRKKTHFISFKPQLSATTLKYKFLKPSMLDIHSIARVKND